MAAVSSRLVRVVEGEGVEVVVGVGEPRLLAGGEELSCLREVFQLTPYLVIAAEYKNYCGDSASYVDHCVHKCQ